MMDWQTVLTVLIVGALFLLMMRGCRSMTGGGCCGKGSHDLSDDTGEDTMKHGEDSHSAGA